MIADVAIGMIAAAVIGMIAVAVNLGSVWAVSIAYWTAAFSS
jgi:hypothetical protein